MFDLRILSLTSVAENMLSGLTFGMVGVYMGQLCLGQDKNMDSLSFGYSILHQLTRYLQINISMVWYPSLLYFIN